MVNQKKHKRATQLIVLNFEFFSDYGHFDVILAGDLIYDNNITDAFVNFISKTLALDNSVYFLVRYTTKRLIFKHGFLLNLMQGYFKIAFPS